MDWTTQITINDFKGELKLPLDAVDVVQLNEIIQQQVEEVMTDMLGVDLYDEFAAYMESPTPSIQQWDNLWNGATYTFDGEKLRFKGAKQACIYFIWVEMFTTGVNTTTGNYLEEKSGAKKTDVTVDESKRALFYNKGISIYAQSWEIVQEFDGVEHQFKENRWLF